MAPGQRLALEAAPDQVRKLELVAAHRKATFASQEPLPQGRVLVVLVKD